MTSVDKAAILWSVAIVAVGVAIAGIGGQFIEIGPSTPAPTQESITTPTQESITTPTQESITTPGEPTGLVATKTKVPGYERATSVQDPGMGHEAHQMAILLPPSDKVYSGTLMYDASEPIQLGSLVGPLSSGEDNGQPIWTPDGVTKFALTFIDPKNSKGEWDFVGNAIAVHTMKTNPFIVDYKVNFDEQPESYTVMTGTIESIIDPGLGHQFHSLAIIIPPSEDVYSGTLSYSASEPIQLVSLEGPLGLGETAPVIWTPDGKTNFALTLVDPKNQMGVWEFSGNALALHTMNTKGFTASYAVSSTISAGMTVSAPSVAPKSMGPMTVDVTIPTGTAVPGCEETNECYLPEDVSIHAGDTVIWINADTAAHTVTSGSPTDGPDGAFDSSLFMSGATFEVTFDDSGSYDYFCMVHPWMSGSVQVS